MAILQAINNLNLSARKVPKAGYYSLNASTHHDTADMYEHRPFTQERFAENKPIFSVEFFRPRMRQVVADATNGCPIRRAPA